MWKKLNLVHQNFPRDNIVANNKIDGDIATLPSQPDRSPYPPTLDNIKILENWFLNKFLSTTFNNSKYLLPLMSGSKQHIHLKLNAIPQSQHTPIPSLVTAS